MLFDGRVHLCNKRIKLLQTCHALKEIPFPVSFTCFKFFIKTLKLYSLLPQHADDCHKMLKLFPSYGIFSGTFCLYLL